MIKIIAMVSSTSDSSLAERLCNLSALTAVLLLLSCSAAIAQAEPPAEPAPPAPRTIATVSILKFLGGAAVGLAAHEGGHLLFNTAFDSNPGIRKVSYAGIPFFAITYYFVTPGREFTISSAGFWVQHATSEWLLMQQPRLRDRRSQVRRGWLAFNVLTSAMYAGAAFIRTGPLERDTRGIAVSAGIAEPWVGGFVLAPAVLDTARYFRPESRTLRWGSRAAKLAGVILVLKSKHGATE